MQIGNNKLAVLGHIRYYMRYYMSTAEAHWHHILQNFKITVLQAVDNFLQWDRIAFTIVAI